MESIYPQLTIFTPTYNRSKHLSLLHQSLKNQGVAKESFEWLVIDDGSQDDTQIVLKQLAADDSIQMRYLYKENGGKHSAINMAAEYARGQWIFIIDSDDRLLEQILPTVIGWLKIADQEKNVGVIRALQMHPEKQDLSNKFIIMKNPCNHIEWCNLQKAFDAAEIIRRDVLRNNLFPIQDGERFMAESWLRLSIAEKYDTYYFNIPVIYCKYLADGLSAHNDVLRADSPYSAMLVYEKQYKLLRVKKIRSSINWWRYYWHLKNKKPYHDKIKFYPPKAFSIFGLLMYYNDIFKNYFKFMKNIEK